MRKISYAGIESCGVRAKSFNRMFDTVCDYDDDSYYTTKKTYHHEEDGMSFDYKYAVRIEDLYSISGEEEYKDKFAVDLYLLPTNEYLSKEYLDDVRSACGMEDTDEVYPNDIIDTVTLPLIQSDLINAKSWNSKNLYNVKNDLATVLNCLDSMRGFYMDKYVNRIGTTNWDVLDSCLHGGNPYAKALGL